MAWVGMMEKGAARKSQVQSLTLPLTFHWAWLALHVNTPSAVLLATIMLQPQRNTPLSWDGWWLFSSLVFFFKNLGGPVCEIKFFSPVGESPSTYWLLAVAWIGWQWKLYTEFDSWTVRLSSAASKCMPLALAPALGDWAKKNYHKSWNKGHAWIVHLP